MCGIIGAERLVAYKLHLTKTDKPLTGAEVLSGQKMDLVKSWSNAIDIKSSLLSITCDNVFDLYKTLSATTDEQNEFLTSFVEIVPKDVSYPLLKRLFKADLPVFQTYIQIPKYESRIRAIVKEAKGMK